MHHREDGAAVGDRLVDRELEPLVSVLELRSVERTFAAAEGEPSARRAAAGGVLHALLVEQLLHPAVRGCLERLRPARGRTAVPPRFFAPALERFLLTLLVPALEHRPRKLQELGRRR